MHWVSCISRPIGGAWGANLGKHGQCLFKPYIISYMEYENKFYYTNTYPDMYMYVKRLLEIPSVVLLNHASEGGLNE